MEVLKTPTKIILLVIDGLGGLPHPLTGKTELETAYTPNLDRLARVSELGLIYPVAPGITPGSVPGHLALFGYDPLQNQIGRGIIEALGVGFELKAGDVAARGNFCTLDNEGRMVDRRAGRISDQKCGELCQKLSLIPLNGAQLFILPVKEHRFVLILRGEGLNPNLSDTDPQKSGFLSPPAIPLTPEAQKTASIVNDFIYKASKLLRSDFPANGILLRGFSSLSSLPTLPQLYNLSAAALASYPMYRGLSKLLGMSILSGDSWQRGVKTLKENFNHFDFFYFHIKETDIAGEDGDFKKKVSLIEEIDCLIPEILELSPDVLIVTGDHSTPAVLRSHSHHPVPFLLFSPFCRHSEVDKFGERSCYRGTLGCFAAKQTLTLALAYGGKLKKFGP